MFVSSMKTRHKNNIHSSNIRSGSLHSIDLVQTYISIHSSNIHRSSNLYIVVRRSSSIHTSNIHDCAC